MPRRPQPDVRRVMSITRMQRRLRTEVEQIAATVKLDIWNIEQYHPTVRTVALDIMRPKLIRGEVIIRYTLIDEYLTNIICHYYFHRPKKSHRELWKTKRFRIFVQTPSLEMPTYSAFSPRMSICRTDPKREYHDADCDDRGAFPHFRLPPSPATAHRQ